MSDELEEGEIREQPLDYEFVQVPEEISVELLARSPIRPSRDHTVRSPEDNPEHEPEEEPEPAPEVLPDRAPIVDPSTSSDGSLPSPILTPSEAALEFLATTTFKHRKALAEYKSLFTRWKKLPASKVDKYNIPLWAEDKRNILGGEFNHPSIERTVWVPVLNVLREQLEEAREEIEDGKLKFANITLQTVDEFLENCLAHNKELRGAIMGVEYPQGTPPPPKFMPASIDLSEFDATPSKAPVGTTRPGGRPGGKPGGRDLGRGDRGSRRGGRGDLFDQGRRRSGH